MSALHTPLPSNLLRLHRCIPWLWRAASSARPTLVSSAATRSFSVGVSASVATQVATLNPKPCHLLVKTMLSGMFALMRCCLLVLWSFPEDNRRLAWCCIVPGGRKVRAGMDLCVEDRSLGALSNGGAAVVEGGDEKQSPKLLTLVIVRKGEEVLLGMKKRGFGAGYFNGFGGKVEANETVYEAAVRELEEECGVVPVSMEKRGILTFHFDDNPQPWEVHVYHVGDYAGEPCETEEMAPRWFSLADIPYDRMWQDDPIWYPEFLHGRLFKGDFYFHNTHTLVSHTLHVLQKLDA